MLGNGFDACSSELSLTVSFIPFDLDFLKVNSVLCATDTEAAFSSVLYIDVTLFSEALLDEGFGSEKILADSKE